MESVEMVLQGNPREMALRLVGLCGGTAEAMHTLVEGATRLFGTPTGILADRLVAVSREIASMRTESNDAYLLLHRGGRTRKGGMPGIRRFV